jgi:hypothetical protein
VIDFWTVASCDLKIRYLPKYESKFIEKICLLMQVLMVGVAGTILRLDPDRCTSSSHRPEL